MFLYKSGFDKNIISIIIDYVFQKKYLLFENIETIISDELTICYDCEIVTSLEMCGHCHNYSCYECMFKTSNNAFCDECIKSFKQSCECECGVCDLVICEVCFNVMMCKKCRTWRERKINMCFDCSLEMFVPILCCVKCRKKCLVDKYIPEENDTNKYHEWFGDHKCNYSSKSKRRDN